MLKLNKRFWLLFTLVMCSFLFRIAYVNAGAFHHDSVQLTKGIDYFIEHDYKDVKDFISFRYSMSVIYGLAYSPFQNFIDKTWFLNFFTCFIATLSVLAFYMFTKELVGWRAAMISAALFSFNPLYLSMSTYLKSHSLSMLIIFMMGYCLVQIMISRYRVIYSLTTCVLFVIGLFTRLDIIFSLPFFLILCIMIYSKKKQLPPLIIVIVVNTYFLFVIVYSYLTNLIYVFGGDVSIQPTIPKLVYLINLLRDSLGIPIFVLGFVGMLYAFNFRRRLAITLLCWMIPTSVILGFNTVVSARLLMPVIISLIIFAAILIMYVSSKIKVSWLFPGLFVVLLCLGSVVTAYPILEHRHNVWNMQEMVTELNTLPSGQVIALRNDYGVFVDYYTNHSALPLDNFMNATHIILLQGDNLTVPTYEFITDFEYEEYHHAELQLKKQKGGLFKLK